MLIHVLDGPEDPVTDGVGMRKIVLDYYKDLLCWEPRPGMCLRADFFAEGEQVSQEDNTLLKSKFTDEEIKNAIFGSYSGAPDPDGLPFCSFKGFGRSSWVEEDLDIF